MHKEYSITVICLLILWFISAFIISNDIILPSIDVVFISFINKLADSNFYNSVFMTLKRIVLAFGLSFSIAFVIAILADYSLMFKRLFAPVDALLKTIPNVSYIILSLIWLGQENSVILVTFLVVFPILYLAIINGLNLDDQELKDVTVLYGKSYISNLVHVKLPLSLPAIILGINSSLSLAFKVGVMAEILNQTKTGLGSLLYYAKVNLDMVELFSVTIWIIIISVMINYLFNKVLILVKNKIQL